MPELNEFSDRFNTVDELFALMDQPAESAEQDYVQQPDVRLFDRLGRTFDYIGKNFPEALGRSKDYDMSTVELVQLGVGHTPEVYDPLYSPSYKIEQLLIHPEQGSDLIAYTIKRKAYDSGLNRRHAVEIIQADFDAVSQRSITGYNGQAFRKMADLLEHEPLYLKKHLEQGWLAARLRQARSRRLGGLAIRYGGINTSDSI